MVPVWSRKHRLRPTSRTRSTFSRTLCLTTLLTLGVTTRPGLLGGEPPESSDGPTPTIASQLQQLVDRAVAESEITSAVLILDGPDLHASASAGLTSRHGGSAALSSDAFFIHSVTKTITAALVLKAIESGRFGLDQPIAELLPAELTAGLHQGKGPDRTGEITVRQLLAHRSGLADYFNDGSPGSNGYPPFVELMVEHPTRRFEGAEIVRWVRDHLGPVAAPGAAYHYSDTGYVLLGLMLELAYGATLQEIYRSEVFEPLEMNQTWMAYRDSPRLANERLLHWFEGAEDSTDFIAMTADWAGGGLISTAEDLARFLGAVCRGQFFESDDTLAAMRSFALVEPDVYHGLGIFRGEDGTNPIIDGHEGYGGAFVFYMPERDVVIAGTVNQAECQSAGCDLLWPAVAIVEAQFD